MISKATRPLSRSMATRMPVFTNYFGKCKQITLPPKELKDGYKKMQDMMADRVIDSFAAGYAITTIGIHCYYFAEVAPTLAPLVGLVTAIYGGIFLAHEQRQLHRLKKYQEMSILCDKEGPAKDPDLNRHVLGLLSAPETTIKVKSHKIFIEGNESKEPLPIPSKDTIKRLKKLKTITIPRQGLSPEISKEVNQMSGVSFIKAISGGVLLPLVPWAAIKGHHVHPLCALSALPLAYAGSIFIDAKNYTFFQDRFRDYLHQASTPHEIIQRLVDPVLLLGGFSFMRHWPNENEPIGVSVSHVESLTFKKGRTVHLFKPFPREYFPPKL